MKRRGLVVALSLACALIARLGLGQEQPIPMTAEDKATVTPRVAYLQKNFTNFQALTFRPATNDAEAVIQRLRVNQHLIGPYRERRYTGFRFTTPDWLDGDLEWMYFHLTDEAHKRRRVQADWYIIREGGEMTGFETYHLKPMNAYPALKRRYPNSREVYTQRLSRDRLRPGQNYAIWFGYWDKTGVPDIAVALTIHSDRGHTEFGVLPAR